MPQKTKGQIQQEQAIEASGLLKEEIIPLYEECTENLMGIEGDLMDVAEGKATVSADFINKVFRAFHRVKGAAAYLLHEPMKDLSHTAENVLSLVREGKIELNAALAEVLLPVLSRLKEMAADVDRQREIDCTAELASLQAILTPQKPAGIVLNLAAEPASPTGSVSLRRLRALIVEDELTSRIILQDFLSQYGDCHVAVNGSEAVEAFRAALLAGKRYDLVCMDIRMPVMDGTDAVRHIRDIEEAQGIFSSDGARIFMTTSVQDVRSVTVAFKALCDAYLFKPIDRAELDAHLRAFRLLPSLAVDKLPIAS